MKKNNMSPHGELASASPHVQPNPRQRILVVDDEQDIRRVNSEVLIYCGYHVDAAEDGALAWDALQLNNYDLLITDNNMPKVTGLELLEKIRAAQLGVPVILATGVLPEAVLDPHPWLQLKAVLLKPYTFDELLDTVKYVLYATASNRAEMAPPPNWQGQSLPNRLRV
jgi:CheY-like chemotaxis protein